MRQRNQQHQRSRVMLGSREGTSASSLNSLGFHHKWKAMDPLSPQRQRCFLAPPLSTGPKILPPLPLSQQHSSTTPQEPHFSKDKSNNLPLCSSNRPLPPPQLEEKQKDEEEQINGNSVAKPTPAYALMPAYCRAFSMSNTSVSNRIMDQRIQQSQMGARTFGPSPRTNPSLRQHSQNTDCLWSPFPSRPPSSYVSPHDTQTRIHLEILSGLPPPA